MKYFGWYSATAAAVYGTKWWSTPDGGKLEITTVLSNDTGEGYYFPDKVLRGEVVEWVSDGKPNTRRI